MALRLITSVNQVSPAQITAFFSGFSFMPTSFMILCLDNGTGIAATSNARSAMRPMVYTMR
jgi:hypothetical protein